MAVIGSSTAIKSIQKGTVTSAFNTETDVTISAVVIAKTTVNILNQPGSNCSAQGGSYYMIGICAGGYLSSTTNLKLKTNPNQGSNINSNSNVAHWEVIEYV